MKKLSVLAFQALISSIPMVYLLSLWSDLPDRLPVHWDIHNEADRFGSRSELLVLTLVMAAISLGVSLLLLNIDKIDPKKNFSSDSPLPKKFSWPVVVFIALIGVVIVHESINYQTGEPGFLSGKYLGLALALLFAVIGNFMNNLKPNYFIGIRTPWNLENPDNWRLTHHLASKLWFFGGVLGMLLIVLLPGSYSVAVILTLVVPMAVVPFWYSYRIFSRSK